MIPSNTPLRGRASYQESVAFGTVSFGAVLFVALVGSVVIARIYGVTVIGAFALAAAPVVIVAFLSSAREQAALVRELSTLEPRAPRVTALFAAVYCFSSVLTILVGGLGLLITGVLFRGPLHHPELVLPATANLVAYIVVTNTTWNLDAILTAFRAGRELFWVRLAQSLALLGFGVAGGLAWGTVWGLVLATAASSLTGLIHRLFLIRRYMRLSIDRRELRRGFDALPDLVRFGIKVTPGIIATALCQEVGVWVLAATGSLVAVGAWSRAWGLSVRFLELPSRVTEVLFPTLVARHREADHEGFDRALVDSARYSVTGLMLLAAAGGGAASALMALFGPGFGRAAPALAITLTVPALFAISSIQRHALYAVSRPGLTTVSGLVRLGVTIGVAVPLTIDLGPTGTALALVAGVIAELGCMYRATNMALEAPLHHLWPGRELLAVPMAYTSGFLTSRGLVDVAPAPIRIVVALAGGAAVYVAIFALAGGINDRDRERLTKIFLQIRQRRYLPTEA